MTKFSNNAVPPFDSTFSVRSTMQSHYELRSTNSPELIVVDVSEPIAVAAVTATRCITSESCSHPTGRSHIYSLLCQVQLTANYETAELTCSGTSYLARSLSVYIWLLFSASPQLHRRMASKQRTSTTSKGPNDQRL